MLFDVWCHSATRYITGQLCREGCTTICDDNSWSIMAENNVFGKEVGHIENSSSLNGFDFTESSQIISSDNNPAVVSCRLGKRSGQIDADLFERCVRRSQRPEENRWLHRKKFGAIASSTSFDVLCDGFASFCQ